MCLENRKFLFLHEYLIKHGLFAQYDTVILMKQFFTSAWKPALLLMLLAPLAELISGAMDVATFFSPTIFLPYVLFLYGIPILLLREIAVRYKFGIFGLVCLGMIYGLYNEGVMAQTLFHPLDNPLDIYASYGVVDHLRVPFTMFIIAWHALVSFLLPVTIVHYLFRGQAARPWLPTPLAWGLGIIIAALGTAHFFGLDGGDEGMITLGLAAPYFLILLGAGGLLGWAGARFSRWASITTKAASTSWRPFIAGAVAFILLDVIPFGLAGVPIPWILFAIYFMGLAAAGLWLLRRPLFTLSHITGFVLGAGVAASVVALTAGNFTGIVFGAAFIYLALRVKQGWKASRVAKV